MNFIEPGGGRELITIVVIFTKKKIFVTQVVFFDVFYTEYNSLLVLLIS